MMHAADAVKLLMNEPYELGRTDCLSFMLKFFELVGVEMPKEWEGWTRENYAERWADGYGRTEFHQFLHGLGKPVSLNYMREGDLIIMDAEECAYPAIYLGNNHVLMIFIETGIIVLPLWAIKPKIVEARRLRG